MIISLEAIASSHNTVKTGARQWVAVTELYLHSSLLSLNFQCRFSLVCDIAVYTECRNQECALDDFSQSKPRCERKHTNQRPNINGSNLGHLLIPKATKGN